MPKRREDWASDQLTVQRDATHRDPSMLARGIGANITGCRADIVICDDVEVPNTCGTATEARSTCASACASSSFVLVPDGTQLFVGTPHSYYSIYADEARPETGRGRSRSWPAFTRLELPLLDPRAAGAAGRTGSRRGAIERAPASTAARPGSAAR